jgi:hypothetical protein
MVLYLMADDPVAAAQLKRQIVDIVLGEAVRWHSVPQVIDRR